MVHVRVAFDRHQFVDFDAAGHADAAEVVAFEVDQHHVFGALLRIADQVADARRIVVALEARARAGDGAGFDEIAAHRHQPFRRGADHGPAIAREHAGERRGIVRAQALEQFRRPWRTRELRVPAAADVGLEHVAGGEVIEHAMHAVGEARGIVLAVARRRCPFRQRWQRGECGDVGFDGIEHAGMRGFGHDHAFAAGAIAQDRGRTTQRQRDRQRARRRRQRQHRFDFAGKFVTEV